jgi:hypothetical protein
VAVLATDGEFREGRFAKTAVSLENRLRLAAVTGDAAREKRSVESIVTKLIPGRKRPTVDLRVKRKRSLEKVIVTPDNGATAIRA